MKRGQTIVVNNARDDDFGAAGRHVKSAVIDETYQYRGHHLLWRIAADFLYYVLVPIVALVLIVIYGVRFTNRAAIRKLGGCYIYGNHTHWMDVFFPFMLSYPKRAYIVTGPTAVSIPVVKHLVAMLGGIPLNTTRAGKVAFREALNRVVAQGSPVAIFPEVHEWPYYNGIRDFSPASFTYPVRTSTPVVGYVVTYRRRWLKNRPPHLTVTVGSPVMPQVWEGAANPKQVVRDQVHQFMCDTVRALDSQAWVRYQIGGQPPTSEQPGSPGDSGDLPLD